MTSSTYFPSATEQVMILNDFNKRNETWPARRWDYTEWEELYDSAYSICKPNCTYMQTIDLSFLPRY